MLGIVGALLVVALVVQAMRGHHGRCLARRGVWFGVALIGIPVRIISVLP